MDSNNHSLSSNNKIYLGIKKIYHCFKAFFACLFRLLKIAYRRIKTFFRKESHIILAGTPNYGNMGDELIAVGEKYWLKQYFADKKTDEYTQQEMVNDKNLEVFFAGVKKDDIIFFNGGGNVNDLYNILETLREKVIIHCTKNKIVMFPQSINFSDSERGNEYRNRVSKIYNSHNNFSIMARENTSYKTAKEIFPTLDVFLCPDITTFLFNRLPVNLQNERDGICLCLRNDGEKYYSDEQLNSFINKVQSEFRVFYTDTHIGKAVETDKREEEAIKLIEKLSRYKVVVTDRFHGVIFSVLSKTPCVVLRSADHKIVDGVKWFNNYNGVLYADSIENVPELVSKALSIEKLDNIDFSDYFYKIFNDIFIK